MGLRYNGDIDSFEKADKRMKGGKCVMAHQDKQNDMEATGRKLQIEIVPLIFLCLQRMQEKKGLKCECKTTTFG